MIQSSLSPAHTPSPSSVPSAPPRTITPSRYQQQSNHAKVVAERIALLQSPREEDEPPPPPTPQQIARARATQQQQQNDSLPSTITTHLSSFSALYTLSFHHSKDNCQIEVATRGEDGLQRWSMFYTLTQIENMMMKTGYPLLFAEFISLIVQYCQNHNTSPTSSQTYSYSTRYIRPPSHFSVRIDIMRYIDLLRLRARTSTATKNNDKRYMIIMLITPEKEHVYYPLPLHPVVTPPVPSVPSASSVPSAATTQLAHLTLLQQQVQDIQQDLVKSIEKGEKIVRQHEINHAQQQHHHQHQHEQPPHSHSKPRSHSPSSPSPGGHDDDSPSPPRVTVTPRKMKASASSSQLFTTSPNTLNKSNSDIALSTPKHARSSSSSSSHHREHKERDTSSSSMAPPSTPISLLSAHSELLATQTIDAAQEMIVQVRKNAQVERDKYKAHIKQLEEELRTLRREARDSSSAARHATQQLQELQELHNFTLKERDDLKHSVKVLMRVVEDARFTPATANKTSRPSSPAYSRSSSTASFQPRSRSASPLPSTSASASRASLFANLSPHSLAHVSRALQRPTRTHDVLPPIRPRSASASPASAPRRNNSRPSSAHNSRPSSAHNSRPSSANNSRPSSASSSRASSRAGSRSTSPAPFAHDRPLSASSMRSASPRSSSFDPSEYVRMKRERQAELARVRKQELRDEMRAANRNTYERGRTRDRHREIERAYNVNDHHQQPRRSQLSRVAQQQQQQQQQHAASPSHASRAAYSPSSSQSSLSRSSPRASAHASRRPLTVDLSSGESDIEVLPREQRNVNVHRSVNNTPKQQSRSQQSEMVIVEDEDEEDINFEQF